MWIKALPPHEAEGKLREVYDHVRRTRGKIANILLVQGLNPEALRAHLDLYLAVMYGPSKLTRVQREMIATVVSAHNHCRYCVAHHTEALAHYLRDRSFIEKMNQDLNSVSLTEKEREMLEFSIKLTERTGDMKEADVERLRDVGFSDSEVLDIVLITGYFNLVNRIASALGVEYDESEMKGYKY